MQNTRAPCKRFQDWRAGRNPRLDGCPEMHIPRPQRPTRVAYSNAVTILPAEIGLRIRCCSGAMRTGLSAQTCSAVATCSGRQSCWPTYRCPTQPPTYDGVTRVGRLCSELPTVWTASPAPRLRSCTHARQLQVHAAIAEPPAALVEQESFPRGAQWQARLLLLISTTHCAPLC